MRAGVLLTAKSLTISDDNEYVCMYCTIDIRMEGRKTFEAHEKKTNDRSSNRCEELLSQAEIRDQMFFGCTTE